RRAVVHWTVDLRRLAFDLRRLWDVVGDQCLLRLGRAGDRGLDVLLGAVVRDLREVRREALAGNELPRARLRIARAIPAPREEDVRLLVVEVLEDVARRVLHVEQLRAVHRYEVGLALRHEELGRRRRDEDAGRRALRERGCEGLRRLRWSPVRAL